MSSIPVGWRGQGDTMEKVEAAVPYPRGRVLRDSIPTFFSHDQNARKALSEEGKATETTPCPKGGWHGEAVRPRGAKTLPVAKEGVAENEEAELRSPSAQTFLYDPEPKHTGMNAAPSCGQRAVTSTAERAFPPAGEIRAATGTKLN
ncbi:hypothetical protein DPX16_20599 [Anabarilius grahami]|uniref:Uncharacterized protein n=1 Tax=Anabarilius grahami TaxID=495550 RepID=A0A3N0YL95_ANAGA|nr:hypothetical protein DPX16_20599 [Anabarilius grahami]